jgi:hypothetical protein
MDNKQKEYDVSYDTVDEQRRNTPRKYVCHHANMQTVICSNSIVPGY